ncbi:MAG: helix-turn-helix domain-containing protein [Pseudanabaena sp.]
MESLRNLLAVHLLRNHTQEVVPPRVEVATLEGLRLKQLKDYIEDHLADELAIATLAALIPMSQFHFARAFKAAIGESPHRYITQRRIERAKILLSMTRISNAEIAYQVGFSNQSHFTAQFRKAIGLTPKQFRESARA